MLMASNCADVNVAYQRHSLLMNISIHADDLSVITQCDKSLMTSAADAAILAPFDNYS